MDHLHIRLPAGLKADLKRHCRDQNIAVTSAVIMMIVKELQQRNSTLNGATESIGSASSLGFVLQQ